MDYTLTDTGTLRLLLVEKAKDWSTLDGPGKTEVNKMRDELRTREDTKPVNTSIRQDLNKQKKMKISLEGISKFSPGNDVNHFMAKLSNLYALFEVKNDTDLELAFVRSAKARLCDAYLTELVQSSAATSTFSELKKYLSETFESKVSIYQKLDALWTMEPKPKETFTDLATRLSNEGFNTLTSIRAQYNKQKNNTGDMPDKAFMDIVLAQCMIQVIKNSDRKNVFNLMCHELDTVFSPHEVATKAENIGQKLLKEENIVMPQSFYAGAKSASGEGAPKSDAPNKPKLDCFEWLDTGKCKRGDKCKYKHDEAKQGVGRGSEHDEEPPSVYMSLAMA